MLHPGFIARDTVLPICPDFFCRRAKACRLAAAATPCLCTHEGLDDFYEALARKLNGLMLKMDVDPALIGRERERDYEIEVKLAWFKQMLEERLAEVDAADQAAALSVARPRLKA